MSDGNGFSLDNPKLPKRIKEAALSSGGFPYDKKYDRDTYETELQALQVQLVTLQKHLLNSGGRVVIIFEGRDTAGKSGSISAFQEHLNPRTTIIAALPKPSDRERTQWYFQRYVAYLPAASEIVLFDRSWYNRSGVEQVMGFSTRPQVEAFLQQAPQFERMVVEDGVHLFKFWLSIGREMQMKRFWERRQDPLKQWKLSPIDLKALDLWDDYTKAGEETLRVTDTTDAPWTIILSNDERRARLDTMRVVLDRLDYDGKDKGEIGEIDRKIVLTAPQFLARDHKG